MSCLEGRCERIANRARASVCREGSNIDYVLANWRSAIWMD